MFVSIPYQNFLIYMQELEIVMDNQHISFTTSKIGSLVDVNQCKYVLSFLYKQTHYLPCKKGNTDAQNVSFWNTLKWPNYLVVINAMCFVEAMECLFSFDFMILKELNNVCAKYRLKNYMGNKERFFSSYHERWTKESPWGIKPQTFGFCTLMLYHWATETLWWARPIMKFTSEMHPAYCKDQQCR